MIGRPTSLEMPTVSSCCGCLSLATGLKIFGYFTVLDCGTTIVSHLFSIYSIVDNVCLNYSSACKAMYSDIVIKAAHLFITCLMLRAVRKVSWLRMFLYFQGGYMPVAQHWILWWIFSNFLVAFLDVTALVPALSEYTGVSQWYYLVYRVWDMYGCLIAYSYYKQESRSKFEDCYVVVTDPVTLAQRRQYYN